MTDLHALVREVRARDVVQDGVPVLVALEALPTRPAVLGPAADALVATLAADPARPTPEEVALALEVLAARDFDGDAGPLLRAVNFHATLPARAATLDAQLAGLAARFRSLDEPGLDALLRGDPPPPGPPPVLLAFYEGFREHHDVVLPLLARHGLTGWFVIPTGWIDAPAEDQHALAEPYGLMLPPSVRPGERLAMTWDELRAVAAAGHVIGSHTATHRAVDDLRTDAEADRELAGSRARLEQELDHEVTTVAFMWGAPYGADPRADAAVRRAGYERVISNTKLQRLPD